MTLDLSSLHASSNWPYLDNLRVKVKNQSSRSHDEKQIFFPLLALQRHVFFVVCRVLCAKAVGATSSKGILLFWYILFVYGMRVKMLIWV